MPVIPLGKFQGPDIGEKHNYCTSYAGSAISDKSHKDTVPSNK